MKFLNSLCNFDILLAEGSQIKVDWTFDFLWGPAIDDFTRPMFLKNK